MKDYTRHHTARAIAMRRQIRYRRTLIAAILITTLITIIFSVSALSTSAASSVVKEKHYESVLIEDGDTLTTLSKDFRDDEEQTYDEFVSDVCSANDLSDPDTIHTGCYLLIPVYTVSAD